MPWLDILTAMNDLALFRDQFLLRPDVVFLNHGSFGACPRPVFEAYQNWQLELERQPVEFLGRRFQSLMADARTALGAFVGAAPEDVAYVTNATTGLNIVARSLPLQPGDEVLTADHEYGALDKTWQFICERRDARYVRRSVPVPVTSAEEVIETIWAGVTPRTRVLFLSHITAPTAITLPLAELIRRARERGIWTVVDGAHAPGQIDLNLGELGADFYSGNLHKWALAPKGCAFLYARREVQSLVEPLVVSWGWRSGRFVDELQWHGTHDPAAFLTAPVAFRFMKEHDWPAVRQRCHELVRETRHRVQELTGLPMLTPDDPAWFAQMSTLPMPPGDLPALKRRLYDEFRVEIPEFLWNGQPYLRISIQGYNTPADVEALLTGLRTLLPQVARRG
jgi:isopenicillin-N epimerase